MILRPPSIPSAMIRAPRRAFKSSFMGVSPIVPCTLSRKKLLDSYGYQPYWSGGRSLLSAAATLSETEPFLGASRRRIESGENTKPLRSHP